MKKHGPGKDAWRRGVWLFLLALVSQALYLIPAFSISTMAGIAIDAGVVAILLAMYARCGALVALLAAAALPCLSWGVFHAIDGFMIPASIVAYAAMIGWALATDLFGWRLWAVRALTTALAMYAALLLATTLMHMLVKDLPLLKAVGTAFNDRVFHGVGALLGSFVAFWIDRGRYARPNPR